MRATQSADIKVMLFGFFYLSRTVWFSYAALCVASKHLKRRHKEHAFHEVDPTLVAIAATIYGPTVAWTVGNVAFMLSIFHYLFQITVPTELVKNRFDGCLASTLYTLMLALMPVLYGYFLPKLRNRHAKQLRHDEYYGSFNYNSVKTRLVFQAMQLLEGRVPKGVISLGGTMYRLFEMNPRYKQCPTISFRSSDCFVYCYCDGKFQEKIRLSLLTCLDRNTADKNIAISTAKEASPFLFNLLLPPNVNEPTPRLLLAKVTSPWLMTKVIPISAPRVQDCSWRVVRNRLALTLSVIMFFNVAAMPMKAYFSEPLPWTSQYYPTINNFSEFNTTILPSYQSYYTREHLPASATYYNDASNNTEIFRQVVLMTTPIPLTDCTAEFLVGKPSVLFYGLPIRELLCDFAAANHSTSDASWNNRGACLQITYFAASIGFQCVWITQGNMLANISKPNEFTIMIAHTIAGNSTWHWIKFCYRVCITMFVCYLMWTKYYYHCINLEKLLTTDGHRYDLNTQKKGQRHYELVWGDPTPIILMNPYVATAFFLDCWFSAETVSIVIPRACQSDNIYIMLSAFLYLSRTVWFAYAAVCVVASILKRYHREHIFIEIDPTLVAVFTTFFGPAISWATGNVGFFVDIYFIIFGCFIPAEHQQHQIDAGFPSMFYSLCIASATLLYGFLGGCYRKPVSTLLPSANFSSIWFNGIKAKAMFFTMKLAQRQHSWFINHHGGSIHRLSCAIPRYKKSPTINFCSSDCFIYCYINENVTERIRVTLLTSLDRNLNVPQYAILHAEEPSPFCVNKLLVLGANGPNAPLLLRSRTGSAWCI